MLCGGKDKAWHYSQTGTQWQGVEDELVSQKSQVLMEFHNTQAQIVRTEAVQGKPLGRSIVYTALKGDVGFFWAYI